LKPAVVATSAKMLYPAKPAVYGAAAALSATKAVSAAEVEKVAFGADGMPASAFSSSLSSSVRSSSLSS
jgi:hypothetical protein